MTKGWISSVKLMLISAGILSIALAFKLTLPSVIEIISKLPLLWSVMITWFRPPYLYLVINCIILTIVATSKLQPNKSVANGETDCVRKPPVKVEVVSSKLDGEEENNNYLEDGVMNRTPVVFGYVDSPLRRKQRSPMMDVQLKSTQEKENDLGGGDEFVVSRGRWNSPEKENRNPMELRDCSVSMEKPVAKDVGDGSDGDEFVMSRSESNPLTKGNSTEFVNSTDRKPLASARLGRKSIKASPGGKLGLGVSRPKRDDTLEQTWRNITEGRPVPLTRHLNKCDTWESRTKDTSSSPVHVMGKSETFSDRSSLSQSPSDSVKLRKEPSLSQDELNRRVEAFINKFNEEMRLQRQESLNQYWGTINSGAQ